MFRIQKFSFKLSLIQFFSGNLSLIKFVKILKEKKILLLNDIEHKNFKQIEKLVRNRNSATFYQIASIFNFTELQTFSMCYIERCFPIVCEKNNFKILEFAQVAKIISSSELNIDLEMEVKNAINFWIIYDFEE